jgi:hypothetical protein
MTQIFSHHSQTRVSNSGPDFFLLFVYLLFLIGFNIYFFNLAYLKYLFNYLVMSNYIIKFIKR